MNLYRCDTAALSASEYKTILYGFLKNARLSPALNLDTRNSGVELFPNWTVARLKILADIIFTFSRAWLRLYRCDTAALSVSESYPILNGFQKHGSLSPL